MSNSNSATLNRAFLFNNMDWTRGHIIGYGSSATVSLAASCHSSDVFAVKSAELPRSELLQREEKFLSSLCSPHIVSYKGFDISRENNKVLYNLFMEYMPLGTLSQSVHRHGGRLEEPAIACYTRQVLQGLDYLHSIGLVHCDIKGTNILISEEGAKIADFGCAKRVNDAAAEQISGTPMYMAPEVARGEEQGCPCDIWALGCTVIEMVTGVSPWPNVVDPVSVLYRIAYSGETPEIPGFLSEQAKDFLGKCLKRNPKDRWTATQLLKHPFLEEFNSIGAKEIQESNPTSSPTSILEQGFWSCIEESQSFGNLTRSSFENSPADRIRWLAACSGEPGWRWDEDWMITRGNEAEAAFEAGAISGSQTASASTSTSTTDSTQESEKSNVKTISASGCFSYFCDDKNNRELSVVISGFDSGRSFDQLLPSVSIFL